MTQLDKMQISGIRLFDPNVAQSIKFCPLTLILGVNGAGKTTLIESLRYATSGETPPGSSNGKFWVTDPSLADLGGQIRGQVRLKFRATDGILTQISRSMELNTKRDRNGKVSQQFKTLDSTIIRYEENGKDKQSTLSSRCVEIDKEMLSLVGVSKAVLTNVIFCHQEDNCWPLSEGKVLKEKFDQIFGSVGYVKALAKIKAYRTKKVAEVKALEAVREKYEEIRGQKVKNEKDLTRHTALMEQLRLEKTNLETKLKPVTTELERLNQQESGCSEVRARISKMKGQLQEKVKSVGEVEEQIKEKFVGTLQELEDKETAFRAETGLPDKQTALSLKKERIKEIDEDLTISRSKTGALQIQLGKIEQQEESYKIDATARKDFLASIAGNPDLDFMSMDVDAGDVWDDTRFAQLVSDLKDKVAQLSRELQSKTDEEEVSISQLQEQVDKVNINKAKAQQTIRVKEETQQKRELEMKQLLLKVKQVETTAGTVVENSNEILVAVQALKSKLRNESDAAEVEGKVSNLKLSQCELQEEIMELTRMNHQVVRECVSSVSEIRKEVKDLDDELLQLQSSLKAKRDALKKERSAARVGIEKYKDWIRQLENLNANVAKHLSASCDLDKGNRIRSEIDELSVKITAMSGEKKALESQVSAVLKELNDFEIILHNFKDNRRLLKLGEEIAALNEKICQEEKILPNLDLQALERKKQELKQKDQRIIEELGSIKGKMQSAQQEKQRIQTELQLSKYQSVAKDYKKAMVDLVTQELLNEDLNKYYKVLDQAVSKYHIRRMEQINQQIGHYWRLTYQGTDIKSIKIVCDGDEERTADKRRSFNYRVVMVKDKAEIDMRGRCSAGQKVLASLVIRIALAQVFCVNCSILTLDEPTTNLDKGNIEALARAICSIVEDQKGKIQIVIITHDGEFLKYLNEEFSEFYYEVCKGDDNFSKISRKFLRDRE